MLSGKNVNALDVVIYNFCSTSAGRSAPLTGRDAPKVIKRTEAIEALVPAFEKEGFRRRIFFCRAFRRRLGLLAVTARQQVASNAVIAFGPAFAGKKVYRPPGWKALRKQQIGLLSKADRIDGLVHAYADDPFESSAGLAFLDKVAGIRLIPVDGRAGPASGCNGCYGRRTAFRTCFMRSQEDVILNYLAARLASPPGELIGAGRDRSQR